MHTAHEHRGPLCSIASSWFVWRGGIAAFAVVIVLSILRAAPQSSPPSPGNQVSFKAETNLVLVPVVVRDAQGNALANLRQEDFQLFDNGKAQAIASFSIEETSGRLAGDRSLQDAGEPRAAGPANAALMAIPEHFVALMFDDLHILDPADLLFVRRAAAKFVETLKPTDRLAIFTTSGPLYADFTSDRAKLSEALSKLQKGAPPSFATSSVEERTREVVLQCDEIVRRMSTLPGQRSLIVIYQVCRSMGIIGRPCRRPGD